METQLFAHEVLKKMRPKVLRMTTDAQCLRYMTVKWTEPPMLLPGVQVKVCQTVEVDGNKLASGTTGIVTKVTEEIVEVMLEPTTWVKPWEKPWRKLWATPDPAPAVTVKFSADHLRSGVIQLGGARSWCSWDDPLSGCYSAHCLVPMYAQNVTCCFTVWGGEAWHCAGADVHEWNPYSQDWVRDADGKTHAAVVTLPDDIPVDAHFHIEGPSLHSAIVRAWNAARLDGERQPWEYWPGMKPARVPSPMMDALNTAGGQLNGDRLAAAKKASLTKLEVLLETLESQKTKQDGHYWGFNGLSTVSAGLSIASAATIVAVPVSLGLGLGASAAGLVGTVGETVLDVYTRVEAQSALVAAMCEIQILCAIEYGLLSEHGSEDAPHAPGFWKYWSQFTDVATCVAKPAFKGGKDLAYDIAYTGINNAVRPSEASKVAKLLETAKQAAEEVGALEEFMKMTKDGTQMVYGKEASNLATKLSAKETVAKSLKGFASKAPPGSVKNIGTWAAIGGAVVGTGACIYGWCSTRASLPRVTLAVAVVKEAIAVLKSE